MQHRTSRNSLEVVEVCLSFESSALTSGCESLLTVEVMVEKRRGYRDEGFLQDSACCKHTAAPKYEEISDLDIRYGPLELRNQSR